MCLNTRTTPRDGRAWGVPERSLSAATSLAAVVTEFNCFCPALEQAVGSNEGRIGTKDPVCVIMRTTVSGHEHTAESCAPDISPKVLTIFRI